MAITWLDGDAPPYRPDGGLRQTVQDLADTGQQWVSEGVVERVDTHPSWGVVVTVEERPSGRQIECRPAFLAQGHGRGVYPTIHRGDPVIVLFPRGRTNNAIALCAGAPTTTDPLPSSASPASAEQPMAIVEPGGLDVRKTEAATVEAALRAETFQADLSDFLAAFSTFLLSCSTATFAAQIAAAALVMLNDPRVSSLVSTSLAARSAAAAYSAQALKTQ